MIDNLKEYDDYSENELLKEFDKACIDGDLTLIKQLLTLYNISQFEGFLKFQEEGIKCLCAFNHLDTITGILSSKELKEKLHMDKFYAEIDNFLFDSCGYKSFAVMKYLLTSPDMEKKPNIHTHNHWIIKQLCHFGNLEMIKYVLSSPELKEHADFHTNSDSLFEIILAKERLDIIDFFITEMKLQKTSNIERFLNLDNPFHRKVDALFMKIDLEKELNNKNILKSGKQIKI